MFGFGKKRSFPKSRPQDEAQLFGRLMISLKRAHAILNTDVGDLITVRERFYGGPS